MSNELLITGAAGFAGSHQVDLSIAQGQDVIAQVRKTSDLSNLEKSYRAPNLTVAKLDLTSKSDVDELIRTHQPKTIIHLAALSNPNDAIKNPAGTIGNNLASTFNILYAALRYSPNSTVVLTGSSHEYGIPNGEFPQGLDEGVPLRPQNPYGYSKMMESGLMEQFAKEGLRIVKARVFNHSGPRRADIFLDGRLVKEAVEARKKGTLWTPKIGSARHSRDWQHVSNWNEANLILANEGGQAETYNVASGKPHTLFEFIDTIAHELGIRFEIIEDSTLLRPGDPLSTFGNNEKLRSTTWTPNRGFDEMVTDSTSYWIDKLKD